MMVVLGALRNYFSEKGTFDTTYVVFNIIYAWAWTGLQMTKILQKGFELILKLPDSSLRVPANYTNIQTTDGKPIKILNAFNDKADKITNKFKLFLNFYLEPKNNQSVNNQNAFQFSNLTKFLKTTKLICSYFIDEKQSPENTISQLRQIIISQEPDKQRVKIQTSNANCNKQYYSHNDYVSLDADNKPEDNDLTGELLYMMTGLD